MSAFSASNFIHIHRTESRRWVVVEFIPIQFNSIVFHNTSIQYCALINTWIDWKIRTRNHFLPIKLWFLAFMTSNNLYFGTTKKKQVVKNKKNVNNVENLTKFKWRTRHLTQLKGKKKIYREILPRACLRFINKHLIGFPFFPLLSRYAFALKWNKM